MVAHHFYESSKRLTGIAVATGVILLMAIGYDFAFVKKQQPASLQTPVSESTSNEAVAATSTVSWKDHTYNLFRNLADWKVDENISELQAPTLDPSVLKRFSKGNIFQMAVSFNENSFSGPNADQQMNQADSDQTHLEDAKKKALSDDGWTLAASPTEAGFYQDYLYVKGDHPLVLSTGGRVAVQGGMYVAVEFEY